VDGKSAQSEAQVLGGWSANQKLRFFTLCRNTGSLPISVPGHSIGLQRRNGCEQYESILSGMICAAQALTTGEIPSPGGGGILKHRLRIKVLASVSMPAS
jgi:hypothetical protein